MQQQALDAALMDAALTDRELPPQYDAAMLWALTNAAVAVPLVFPEERRRWHRPFLTVAATSQGRTRTLIGEELPLSRGGSRFTSGAQVRVSATELSP
jgi:hypothetical protein